MRFKDKISRKVVCGVCLAGTAFGLLAGCGEEEVTKAESTAVQIDKDGSVVNTIVDDFSEKYYSLDELKNEIDQETKAYNSSAGDEMVTLQDATIEKSKVRVTMTYADTATYQKFNDVTFYSGTVSEAEAQGYTIPDKMTDSDGNAVRASDITGDMNCVVMSEKISLMTSSSIYCVSDGVKITGSKSADLKDISGDTAFIVLKSGK